MGYSLHIEREEPISVDEWQDAVSSIDGIKLDNSLTDAVNPKTGETISISGSEGDVSVLFDTKGFLGFGKKSSWEKCIFFSNGRGSFNAIDNIESTDNPVHRAAAALAKKLTANIVGDEGETYSW